MCQSPSPSPGNKVKESTSHGSGNINSEVASINSSEQVVASDCTKSLTDTMSSTVNSPGKIMTEVRKRTNKDLWWAGVMNPNISDRNVVIEPTLHYIDNKGGEWPSEDYMNMHRDRTGDDPWWHGVRRSKPCSAGYDSCTDHYIDTNLREWPDADTCQRYKKDVLRKTEEKYKEYVREINSTSGATAKNKANKEEKAAARKKEIAERKAEKEVNAKERKAKREAIAKEKRTKKEETAAKNKAEKKVLAEKRKEARAMEKADKAEKAAAKKKADKDEKEATAKKTSDAKEKADAKKKVAAPEKRKGDNVSSKADLGESTKKKVTAPKKRKGGDVISKADAKRGKKDNNLQKTFEEKHQTNAITVDAQVGPFFTSVSLFFSVTHLSNQSFSSTTCTGAVQH